MRALDHLRGLLVPSGRLFLTVPLGHNPGLDAAIDARGSRAGSDTLNLVRGRGNTWTEAAELPEGRTTTSGTPPWPSGWASCRPDQAQCGLRPADWWYMRRASRALMYAGVAGLVVGFGALHTWGHGYDAPAPLGCRGPSPTSSSC